jgi:hypothetical protein
VARLESLLCLGPSGMGSARALPEGGARTRYRRGSVGAPEGKCWGYRGDLERRSVCGRFSHTGSAGRSPSARPCRPATVVDFPSRLARGRAHALPEVKCWHRNPRSPPTIRRQPSTRAAIRERGSRATNGGRRCLRPAPRGIVPGRQAPRNSRSRRRQARQDGRRRHRFNITVRRHRTASRARNWLISASLAALRAMGPRGCQAVFPSTAIPPTPSARKSQHKRQLGHTRGT